MSFTACHASFDGLAACGANDTMFLHSRVAKKGGAVALASGDGRSQVELHRCRVYNSSTGIVLKDDPQGEGGAFSVGGGVTLLLSDCALKNNYCGKKVSYYFTSVDTKYRGNLHGHTIYKYEAFICGQQDDSVCLCPALLHTGKPQ